MRWWSNWWFIGDLTMKKRDSSKKENNEPLVTGHIHTCSMVGLIVFFSFGVFCHVRVPEGKQFSKCGCNIWDTEVEVFTEGLGLKDLDAVIPGPESSLFVTFSSWYCQWPNSFPTYHAPWRCPIPTHGSEDKLANPGFLAFQAAWPLLRKRCFGKPTPSPTRNKTQRTP